MWKQLGPGTEVALREPHEIRLIDPRSSSDPEWQVKSCPTCHAVASVGPGDRQAGPVSVLGRREKEMRLKLTRLLL